MNQKRRRTAKERKQKANLEMRMKFWPHIGDDQLWHGDRSNPGYTLFPRSLPIILGIMDDISTGGPLSPTYIAVWCRSYDQIFLEIPDYNSIAFESGFSGNRAVSTWKTRMKELGRLGFISCEAGPSGDFHFVLLLNPYNIIKKHEKSQGMIKGRYNALVSKAIDISAKEADLL